jgi:hypothetical protein
MMNNVAKRSLAIAFMGALGLSFELISRRCGKSESERAPYDGKFTIADTRGITTGNPADYYVIVGTAEASIMISNCVSITLHTNDCYLVEYVQNGVTNEFHAWMAAVRLCTRGAVIWAAPAPSKEHTEQVLKKAIDEAEHTK